MADRVARKMAVIFAADVAGYSRLVGEDEEGTLATLRAYREVVDRLIAQHDGRVFGSAGDSVVAEFASPVEAVRSATEIQHELARRNAGLPEASQLRFRIGINLGDVVVEGDSLMGDGVNVAARLEAMARAGGICVSETVYSQARDRLSLDFVDLGEHKLKNIARPVRAYRVPLSSEEQVSSPFRGLEVFEFENADLFFGRARAITACIERLQHLAADGKAFLLIYGMSGSGKSSLLRAGLLPSVTRPGAVAGIAMWRRCLFRPSEGADAVAALTAALFREEALPELAVEVDAAEFTQLGRSAPERALALMRAALVKAAGEAGAARSQARLLVAVDQLEELFTTEKHPSAREALVRLMATLAGSGLVWVIATIRSDFFHRCGEVRGFSALKDGLASYELLPPTGPEIAQIIREPARAAGLRFDESPDQGRLDDVLQEAAAADPGSLPLLEFVLDALYEAGREQRVLTFAQYRALGGLEGAIARRADEVVEALSPAIQDALPAVLRALTTVRPGDEKATARRVAQSEIAARPAQHALVEALIASRLLVSDEENSGHVFVRLAHEALLSRWPRAAEIVNANRNFLETRARLSSDAQRWHSEDRNRELLLPAGKRLAEGEELLLSRREEVDDQIAEYIEASLRAQQEREERDRQAERAHVEAEAAAATRLARRTRIAAVISLTFAVVAGVGAFVGLNGQREAVRQATLAEQKASDAKTAEQNALDTRDQALRSQSLLLALLSQDRVATGDTETAILLALEALPSGPSASDRPYVTEAEGALFKALLAHRQIRVLTHPAGVADAAFDASGTRIVTASFDGTARIWDVETGSEVVALKGHQGPVERAAFSPEGTRIITAARDRTARVWDSTTGAQRFVIQPVGDYPTAVFSPDGTKVLTAGDGSSTTSVWDAQTGGKLFSAKPVGSSLASFNPNGLSFAQGFPGSIRVWSAADGRLEQWLRVNTFPYSVVFSPDGGKLLVNGTGSVTFHNSTTLWDLIKGVQIADLTSYRSDSQLQGTFFSHSGRRIASVSLDGSARIWDGSSGELVATLGQETAGLKLSDVSTDDRDSEMNGAFSRDDRLLATASYDGRIRVWDHEHSRLVATIPGHTDLVEHLEFSPVDKTLLSASHDGTARVWDLDGILATTLDHEYRPLSAAFSPDALLLLTVGGDSKAHLWDIAAQREIGVLDTGHISQNVAFSPDGTRAATASLEGRVVVWDVGGKRKIADIAARAGLNGVEFSPRGDVLASASVDGTAKLWNVTSGAELAVIKTNVKLPRIVFSKDGDLLLAAGRDNSARLLGPDGREIRIISGHHDLVTAGAFSPDGKLLVTGSADSTARIWSVVDAKNLAVLEGHLGAITAVDFNPDGRSVLTASSDGTTRIWSVPTGTETANLRGQGPVDSAKFSPNGAYVLTTSSQDRTVRLWEARSGREIAILSRPRDKTNRSTLTRADFSPDGTSVLILAGDESVQVIHVFKTPWEMIDYARNIVQRQLTACERKRYFLPVHGEVAQCPG